MKLCLLVLAALVGLSVAPFPEEHPYNWANPLIEPWWVKLEPEEQKEVYSQWHKIEPFMKAVAVWKERLVRTGESYGDVLTTGSTAYLARAEELGRTLLGLDDSPDQGEGNERTRLKSDAQEKWEDYEANFQFAAAQSFKTDRAKYQKFLEIARLIRKKKDDLFLSDDESWLQQFKDNLNIDTLQFKDQVESFLDSKREGLFDKKAELWHKIQKSEAQIRDFLDNTKEEIRKKLWVNNVINKRK